MLPVNMEGTNGHREVGLSVSATGSVRCLSTSTQTRSRSRRDGPVGDPVYPRLDPVGPRRKYTLDGKGPLSGTPDAKGNDPKDSLNNDGSEEIRQGQ